MTIRLSEIRQPIIALLYLISGLMIAHGESTKRTCRILFLQGPDSAPASLHLFDGTNSQEVELPRLNLSPLYELPPGNLTLRLLTAPPSDPKNLPAEAPSAKVSETMTDFFLLLTSDPSNTVAPVRIQVINAGADRLKSGQMLWFNLTDHQVGGILGSERLAMKPKSSVTVDPPAARAENYAVNLSYRIEGKEHLYPICETKWLHDPRSRSLAFIFTRPGSRTPRVQAFTDFRAK